MNRREFAKFSLSTALSTLAIGGVAPRALAAEDVVLSFPTWQSTEPGLGDWWRAVIAEFEADNPGVTIKMEQIAPNDYDAQLLVRYSSGQYPDIALGRGVSFGSFASQGWYESLDQRLQKDPLPDGWSSQQSDMKWGGETVGLGIIRYSFMLFYNQKILDNAGVQVPTNFEEFKAAVTNITDVNAGVYGIASATAETSSSLFNEITQYVRWLGGDFVKDGKYSITAPETVAALEEYRQLISKNSALGVDQMMSRQLFLNGSAGFLIDGSWVLPLLDKATPELRPNLKMVALPFEPRSGGIANSLHIPAGISDERKDLVWSFYQKVVSPKWQQQCLLMCGVPVGLETALTEEMRKTHPHLVEIMSAAKGALPMIPIIDKLRAQAREYSTIINRVGVRLVSTQVPTDQIAEEAFGEVQKAIPL